MKTTEFKTNLGETIKVRANYSKKHFTIKTESGKYRTTPMAKEEFNLCLNNTGNDWRHFLSGSGDYYKI